MVDCVIAVDPGKDKCGVAVVHKQNGVLDHMIVESAALPRQVEKLLTGYEPTAIILGNGTTSKETYNRLLAVVKNIRIITVDEYRTTELAITRYWQENPPHGWRRLLPTTLQVPPRPVDDYVAVILAERYLQSLAAHKQSNLCNI